MSRVKAIDAGAQADAHADQFSDRATQFQVIPQVCLVGDVCRILRLSTRQFHYLMARHELALSELPRFDRRRRFTGESVARVIRMRAPHVHGRQSCASELTSAMAQKV